MKKLLLLIFSLFMTFTLVSCDEIKETVNEVKKALIIETVDSLTEELGIENFEVPECEALNLDLKFDVETDKSDVVLTIEKPVIELSEYKDDLVNYIAQALPEEVLENDSIEPVEVENGYKWEYSFTETNDEGEEVDYSVEVLLTEVDGNFYLDLGLIGAGDISQLIKENLDKIENTKNE